jgi:hypothetical protein
MLLPVLPCYSVAVEAFSSFVVLLEQAGKTTLRIIAAAISPRLKYEWSVFLLNNRTLQQCF